MSDRTGTLYTGSLNLTDLLAFARAQHSAFTRSPRNEKAYVNISIWVNEEPNKIGQEVSIQLQSKKDARDAEEVDGKPNYIGGGKKWTPKPVNGTDPEFVDDLPF